MPEKEREEKAAAGGGHGNKKSLDYLFESVVGGGSWYQWTTVFCMIPLMMSGEWPLTVRHQVAYTRLGFEALPK